MLNIMGNIPEYSRNIDVFWFADVATAPHKNTFYYNFQNIPSKF